MAALIESAIASLSVTPPAIPAVVPITNVVNSEIITKPPLPPPVAFEGFMIFRTIQSFLGNLLTNDSFSLASLWFAQRKVIHPPTVEDHRPYSINVRGMFNANRSLFARGATPFLWVRVHFILMHSINIICATVSCVEIQVLYTHAATMLPYGFV